MKLFVNSLKVSQETLILSGVTYPNDLGYQNIAEDIIFKQAFGNYQFGSSVLTVQDKTFIVLLGAGSLNKFYLLVFDRFTNKVSDLIDTGLSALGDDVHHSQTIHETTDGRLFFCYTDRSQGGNKRRFYSHTGNNYDVLNWGAFVEVTEKAVEYPHIKTFSDGKIYDVCRYFLNTDWKGIVWTSADNGENWTIQNTYIDFVSAVDERPYPLMVYTDDNVLRIFINHLENYKDEQEYFYYLESYDNGFTWQNIDNTFSQDTTSTPLSMSTLQTNYTALQVTGGAFIRSNYATMIDEKPYAIGGINTDKDLGLIYWDGAAWQAKEIISAGHTFYPSWSPTAFQFSNGTVLKKVGGLLNLYIQENVLGKAQLSLFTSSNDGDTWVFIEQITSQNLIHNMAKHNLDETKNDLLVSSVVYSDEDSGDIYIKRI